MSVLIGVLSIVGSFCLGIYVGCMIAINYIKSVDGGQELLERILGK